MDEGRVIREGVHNKGTLGEKRTWELTSGTNFGKERKKKRKLSPPHGRKSTGQSRLIGKSQKAKVKRKTLSSQGGFPRREESSTSRKEEKEELSGIASRNPHRQINPFREKIAISGVWLSTRKRENRSKE